MNLDIGKCRLSARRCEVVVSFSTSWKVMDRQCKNTAKFVVNGQCMCNAHTQRIVFKQYLLEYPPV